MGLEIHQLDVVTTYLSREFKENVFIRTPQGLKNLIRKVLSGKTVESNRKAIQDKKVIKLSQEWIDILQEDANRVCLLIIAFYGLKQSEVE